MADSRVEMQVQFMNYDRLYLVDTMTDADDKTLKRILINQ
jgi:hypothetical protein